MDHSKFVAQLLKPQDHLVPSLAFLPLTGLPCRGSVHLGVLPKNAQKYIRESYAFFLELADDGGGLELEVWLDFPRPLACWSTVGGAPLGFAKWGRG
jgi:hypothetical protein